MSTIEVKVSKVDDVRPHPNADALDILVVGGWQVVGIKDDWVIGDPCVYFTVDTVLPQECTDRFNVTKYCSPVSYLEEPHFRIRCAKLRGEPSFGLAMHLHECGLPLDTPVGTVLTDYFSALKYVPPLKFGAEDAEPNHPLFIEYTEIENIRTYPNILNTDDVVAVSAKIHGSSSRVGLIEGQRMAGSHKLRRKEPSTMESYKDNRYWFPWSLPGVSRLLEDLGEKHNQVILFGEIFGPSIQGKFSYGLTRELGFRAFDLLLDGKYVDYNSFLETMFKYNINMVPQLAVSNYGGLDWLRSLAEQPEPMAQGKHPREGVVVKTVTERHNPTTGRTILKYISDTFLLKDYGAWLDQ